MVPRQFRIELRNLPRFQAASLGASPSPARSDGAAFYLFYLRFFFRRQSSPSAGLEIPRRGQRHDFIIPTSLPTGPGCATTLEETETSSKPPRPHCQDPRPTAPRNRQSSIHHPLFPLLARLRTYVTYRTSLRIPVPCQARHSLVLDPEESQARPGRPWGSRLRLSSGSCSHSFVFRIGLTLTLHT